MGFSHGSSRSASPLWSSDYVPLPPASEELVPLPYGRATTFLSLFGSSHLTYLISHRLQASFSRFKSTSASTDQVASSRFTLSSEDRLDLRGQA
nr:hypothetical protein Q903MT_gene3024 [Picea sitchensis]